MGADPVRPPVDQASDRLGFLRELVLLVNALTYFMRTRKPRSATDVMIRPQSAINILLGANRVLRANFSSFIPLASLKLPLRGLMRRFVQRFGPTSLVLKRREPFTNGMIQPLVNLPEGFNVGVLGALASGSCLRKMWRAARACPQSS